MKKLLVIIAVLTLVSKAQAGILLSAGDIAFGDLNMESLKVIADCESSVFLTESAIYLQCEDGSAYLLVLPTAENSQQTTASAANPRFLEGGNIIIGQQRDRCLANTSIIDLLPDWWTIMWLAFAGFFWNRRKKPLIPQTVL